MNAKERDTPPQSSSGALLAKSPRGRLAVEVHHLRLIFREAAQRFAADVEGEIVRTIELASDLPDGSETNALLRRVVREIQEIDVKPRKGRLGDLKRIRKLVKRVNEQLEDKL